MRAILVLIVMLAASALLAIWRNLARTLIILASLTALWYALAAYRFGFNYRHGSIWIACYFCVEICKACRGRAVKID